MPLERDDILLENLRQSLNLYQRAMVWSMTASAAVFLITLRGTDAKAPPVQVLYGELNAVAAWVVGLGFFFLCGGYASAAISRAGELLRRLKPTTEVRDAILLTPSLATIKSRFYRIGSVLVCPVLVLGGFGFDIWRVWDKATHGLSFWLGLGVTALIVTSIYSVILFRVWYPFGERSTEPLTPYNSTDRSG